MLMLIESCERIRKVMEETLCLSDWSRVILTAMTICRMERWTFWT